VRRLLTARLVTFDLGRPYRLNPAATLRPEPFGALAYHFGNRRLSFLKSRQLVSVVRLLSSHDSAAGALEAAGVPVRQWGRYAAALAALADSEVIDER
jgi:putative mycofactocin binding protein MftB